MYMSTSFWRIPAPNVTYACGCTGRAWCISPPGPFKFALSGAGTYAPDDPGITGNICWGPADAIAARDGAADMDIDMGMDMLPVGRRGNCDGPGPGPGAPVLNPIIGFHAMTPGVLPVFPGGGCMKRPRVRGLTADTPIDAPSEPTV